MECRELKEIISAYADGETSPEECLRVEEHIGACAGCGAALKRMRALGVAAARMEGEVPWGFRERLFERMEREELLPKRRSIFAYSIRWAAVPLAAAAALALYVLSGREAPRDRTSTAVRPPQVATRAADPGKEEGRPAVAFLGQDLSGEEREIVAYLEVLEDPDLFDRQEVDEMEIFITSPGQQG